MILQEVAIVSEASAAQWSAAKKKNRLKLRSLVATVSLVRGVFTGRLPFWQLARKFQSAAPVWLQ